MLRMNISKSKKPPPRKCRFTGRHANYFSCTGIRCAETDVHCVPVGDVTNHHTGTCSGIFSTESASVYGSNRLHISHELCVYITFVCYSNCPREHEYSLYGCGEDSRQWTVMVPDVKSRVLKNDCQTLRSRVLVLQVGSQVRVKCYVKLTYKRIVLNLRTLLMCIRHFVQISEYPKYEEMKSEKHENKSCFKT